MSSPPNKKRFRRRRSRLGLFAGAVVFGLIALYVGMLVYSRPSADGRPLRFDQLLRLAEAGRIEEARILDADAMVVGTYRSADGSSIEFRSNYSRSEVGIQNVLGLLVPTGVPIDIEQQFAKTLIEPLTLLIPALIIVTVLIYLILSFRHGTGLFSIKSGAQLATGDQTVTFADVAGQDTAVDELREIAQFLEDPGRFVALGARIPKGILIYGPPGCGKTLMARALAGESGSAFFAISGSDFVEMFVGVGASRVRQLFREARDNAPAIVFIDEIDSIGRRRTSGPTAGSQDEQEQALNQILAEMDGFSPAEGIVVLGATNRPDVLDPALLRPGRFDRAIGLDRPDEQGRLAVLQVHARGKPLASDVDLRATASRAIGLNGADLANVVNEAALLTARAGKRAMGQTELNEALRRVIEAPERQRRLSMRARTLGQRSIAEERVTFSDVAGVEEALVELVEVKSYLDNPERYASLGARPPRGFLLVGPPGCGKTLLARAVAGEANATFISVAATEFTEVYVGEGAARVRDLFADARSTPPAIVFIDEIDAIGARRGASADGAREREQTLNQILIELDGFGPRDGVIVLAASNRPEILDPALVRPGRFDRTITINLPDPRSRRAILDVHAAGKPLAPEVDLDEVAALTRGFSGADLANVMNEAALLAARRSLPEATMALIEEAIARVGLGVSRAYVLRDDERNVVAYHEAGHAVIGLALPGIDLPGRVSIIPRGQALGTTYNLDTGDRLLHSRTGLVDKMAAMLGGRAAEQLVFGEPSSGAVDDLDRVTQLARSMVLRFGMSESLGTITYADGNGNNAGDGRLHWRPSEETARLIDSEVRKVVDEANAKARAVLVQSRGTLERIARALIEKETLTASDIERLAGGAPPGPRSVRRN